jgi:hypothetical protein
MGPELMHGAGDNQKSPYQSTGPHFLGQIGGVIESHLFPLTYEMERPVRLLKEIRPTNIARHYT